VIHKNNFVITCITLLFGVIILLFETTRFGDFEVFLGASKALVLHKNIYETHYIDGFRYFYSPLFATFLSFFSTMPDLVPLLIWKILNLFFLYRTWIIMEKMFIDYKPFSNTKKIAFQLIVFSCSFFLFFSSLHLSQLSLLLLYGIMEGVYQIREKKNHILGAFVLALVINIKIMPLVIVPWLLYRAEFRSTIYVLLFTIVLLFLPAIFIGFEYNLIQLGAWWKTVNPSNQEHILDLQETGFHGLSSLIASLCYAGFGNHFDLGLKRNIVSLDPQTISYIINFVRLILIAYTLKILQTKPFVSFVHKTQLFHELAYILLVTPLIFPHQQVYGFLFAFPAIVFCIYYFALDLNKKLSPKKI
jgi:hypothetical protein